MHKSFFSLQSLSTFFTNKNQYVFAIINGLLGSSCCLIQLILNLFSIGCAGFSVLTPYRTIFLGMSTMFIISLFYKYGFRSKQRTFKLLFIILFLSFLPELVLLYNQGKLVDEGKLGRAIGLGKEGVLRLGLFGGGNQLNEEKTQEQKVEVYVMKIKGIKCEGCANRIKSFFDQKPNIINSKVFFNNQSIIIEVWPIGSYNNNNNNDDGEIFKIWIKTIDFQYEPIILQKYIITKKV
jgi:hypothetical protein